MSLPHLLQSVGNRENTSFSSCCGTVYCVYGMHVKHIAFALILHYLHSFRLCHFNLILCIFSYGLKYQKMPRGKIRVCVLENINNIQSTKMNYECHRKSPSKWFGLYSNLLIFPWLTKNWHFFQFKFENRISFCMLDSNFFFPFNSIFILHLKCINLRKYSWWKKMYDHLFVESEHERRIVLIWWQKIAIHG